MLFAHKLGNELSDEEMQEIVELLIAKDIFDRKMYEEHQVLTSVHIQKVWLEATKRRKRDLTPLPYFLMETKVPKTGKKKMRYRMYCFHQKMHAIPNKVKKSKVKKRKTRPSNSPRGERRRRNGGLFFRHPGICLQQEDTQSGRFDVGAATTSYRRPK